MAVFNPSVPDAPEPNYLRYSRPSNYAEPNKALGEAFKGAGEVVSQGLRTVDSLVKEGLKQEVHDRLDPVFQQEIQGLQSRRDDLYGSNISGRNNSSPALGYADESLVNKGQPVPQDVKNFPQRLQNLQDTKANGTYSASYVDSIAYKEMKDLREKFPAFRGYIDQQSSQITGERDANRLRSSLISDINSAEAQLKEGKNKLESEAYQALNRHELTPINFEAWKQGKLDDAGLRARIYAGNGRRNSLEMDKLEFEKQEHDRTRQANIAEDSIRSDSVKGLANDFHDIKLGFDIHTPDKFARKLSDMSEGRIPKANDEQLLQMRQTLESQRELFRQGLYQRYTEAGYHKALAGNKFNELIEEQLQPYDHVLSMIKDGKHENAYASMNYVDAAVGSRKQELISDKTVGPEIARGKAVEELMPEMAKDIAKSYIMNSNLPKDVASFNWSETNKAVAKPKPGEATPTQIEAWRKLNLHAPNAPAQARMDLARVPAMLGNPKLPDEQAKQVIDYAFNPGLQEMLLSIERDHKDPSGKFKAGRYSIWDDLTAQPQVDRAYKLGGQSWEKFKDGTTTAFRGMFGQEVNRLAQEEGQYKFSYNSDTQQFRVERKGGFKPPVGHAISYPQVTPWVQGTVDNINRGLKGLARINSKDTSLDVNQTVLSTLEEIAPSLQNTGVHRQIMDAVIASHKSSQPEQTEEPKHTGDVRSGKARKELEKMVQ